MSQPEHLDGLVIPSPTTTLKITNDASMSEMETPTLITFGADDALVAKDMEKVRKLARQQTPGKLIHFPDIPFSENNNNFEKCSYRNFSNGIVSIHSGWKY